MKVISSRTYLNGNVLYLLLPILFSILVQLLFSYGNWDINPKNWYPETRVVAAFLMGGAIILGTHIAYVLNKKIK
jgi:hypothetical protein